MQLIEHIKSAPDEESFFARLVEVHEWQPQFGKVRFSNRLLNGINLAVSDKIVSVRHSDVHMMCAVLLPIFMQYSLKLVQV